MSNETLRLFIALKLPETLATLLAREQDALRQSPEPVKWVAPEGLHLTLQFLGSVDAGRVAELLASLEAAAAESAPLTLRLRGLGAFPNVRRPRVIWAGLEGGLAELGQLQRRVVAGTTGLGFKPEERPFKPHLTLGRVREGASQPAIAELGRAVAARSFEPEEQWPVREVLLIKSELRPGGPIYTALGQFPLGQSS